MENVMNGKVCEAEKIDARKDTVISLSGEIRKEIREVDQILDGINRNVFCGCGESSDEVSPDCLMDELRLSLKSIKIVKEKAFALQAAIVER